MQWPVKNDLFLRNQEMKQEREDNYEEFKTLGMTWNVAWGLIIRVLSYADRKRLYIGLYKEENGEWEDFGNLTVNLPHEDVKKNEAFIDHNFFESKLQFIKKYQLGEILPETAVSGYCTFSKVAFDLDRLEEFDPDGVCAYRELHGEKSSSEDEEEDLDDYTLIKKMHDLTERYLTLDDGLSSAEKAAFLKVEIAEVAYAFYINNVFSWEEEEVFRAISRLNTDLTDIAAGWK